MNEKRGIIVLIFMLFLAMTSCECMAQEIQQAAGTVQITDMLGRQLTVPENISSVIATSPPSTILVFMLAPDKVVSRKCCNFVAALYPTIITLRPSLNTFYLLPTPHLYLS
jgi:iron complex transport system substrate-binding protein